MHQLEAEDMPLNPARLKKLKTRGIWDLTLVTRWREGLVWFRPTPRVASSQNEEGVSVRDLSIPFFLPSFRRFPRPRPSSPDPTPRDFEGRKTS
ncbi:hypothetical protein ZWY2020_041823 [Hordeum vulgare]|nr:hypothetical protein ZWY2020_041823 [Hordeum vulgare]